jgi:hypothetical protein
LGRADPAVLRQIQDEGTRQNTAESGTLKPGLCLGVIEQQQQQVFGDARHKPRL